MNDSEQSKQSQQAYLYPRLASFYFFFFATLGAFVPYWSIYLQSLHFNPAEIGELMAIVMASKLVAPYFLGWLSDHFQKSLFIIQTALVLSVITFSGVFVAQSYWWMVLVMLTFGFAWNATLPLFEALTLNHLEGDTHHYSLIRLWGSIGFIILVAGLPNLITDSEISKLPFIVLGLLLANTLITFFISEKKHNASLQSPINISSVIKNPIVVGLLVACAFQAISHGAYYTFFSIYLEEHGYSRSMTGWMWAIGVMAEVALFLMMHRLLQYYHASWLFALALMLTTIRWILLAFWVENMMILIFSQFLHAASFGLFHAAAIYLIHDLFPGRLQMRGQALYAGISFGLGGSLGSLLSGYTWTSLGSTGTFLLSSALAFIGAMIAFKYVTTTTSHHAKQHK
jgi:PPP family 3-phenylpropionic acid transporter